MVLPEVRGSASVLPARSSIVEVHGVVPHQLLKLASLLLVLGPIVL